MKKIATFLYIIVFLIFLIALDYISVRFLKSKPFLAVKSIDGINLKYDSLLYDVHYCIIEDGSFERTMTVPNEEFECRKIIDGDIVIVYEDIEEYDPNNPIIETFYEDDEYICTFKGNRSDKVFLKYNNGDYTNIKNALRRGEVSVPTLISKGINCEKKEKNNEEVVEK